MSGYLLEATDGGGRTPLPSGETMIGRGPFLHISDKRVSRNHALLEVVDDKLRIKPVHVNPCFYQGTSENTFLPLEKDKWHSLHCGDCFSLLPDKYAFRVVTANFSKDSTERAIHDISKVNTSNENDRESRIAIKKEPSCSVRDSSEQAPLHHVPNSQTEKSKTIQSSQFSTLLCKNPTQRANSVQRKRVLPDWMLQDGLEVETLSSPATKTGKNRRTRRKGKMNTNATLEDCAVLPGTSSYSLQIGSVDKKSNTEDKNGDVEDLVQNNQNDSRASQDYERNKSNENVQRIQSTGSSSVMHSKASTSQTASSNMQSLISKDESFCEISGDNHGGDQAAKKRTSCIYGEKCYRKNPAHFEEFCHPGDSDYVNTENESQDDSDDRPECPYGTDCYRKNPQHKLEYKHTMPPGRKLRRRAPKKVQSVLDDDSDNDGEPNAYDFEDSFINDEEEEDFDNTDEDSDWMPNSEEKDSEDVTNLLKEAKKFMKSKH